MEQFYGNPAIALFAAINSFAAAGAVGPTATQSPNSLAVDTAGLKGNLIACVGVDRLSAGTNEFIDVTVTFEESADGTTAWAACAGNPNAPKTKTVRSTIVASVLNDKWTLIVPTDVFTKKFGRVNVSGTKSATAPGFNVYVVVVASPGPNYA